MALSHFPKGLPAKFQISMLAKVGSNSAVFDRLRPKFGPGSAIVAPMSTKLGRTAVDQVTPKPAWNRLNLNWNWPKLGSPRPTLVRYRPNLGDVGQTWAGRGGGCGRFCPKRHRLGRHRPSPKHGVIPVGPVGARPPEGFSSLRAHQRQAFAPAEYEWGCGCAAPASAGGRGPGWRSHLWWAGGVRLSMCTYSTWRIWEHRNARRVHPIAPANRTFHSGLDGSRLAGSRCDGRPTRRARTPCQPTSPCRRLRSRDPPVSCGVCPGDAHPNKPNLPPAISRKVLTSAAARDRKACLTTRGRPYGSLRQP